MAKRVDEHVFHQEEAPEVASETRDRWRQAMAHEGFDANFEVGQPSQRDDGAWVIETSAEGEELEVPEGHQRVKGGDIKPIEGWQAPDAPVFAEADLSRKEN